MLCWSDWMKHTLYSRADRCYLLVFPCSNRDKNLRMHEVTAFAKFCSIGRYLLPPALRQKLTIRSKKCIFSANFQHVLICVKMVSNSNQLNLKHLIWPYLEMHCPKLIPFAPGNNVKCMYCMFLSTFMTASNVIRHCVFSAIIISIKFHFKCAICD